jgi:hypothetical protein
LARLSKESGGDVERTLETLHSLLAATDKNFSQGKTTTTKQQQTCLK